MCPTARPGDLPAKSLVLLQDSIRRGGPVERRIGLVVGGRKLLDFAITSFTLEKGNCSGVGMVHRKRCPG